MDNHVFLFAVVSCSTTLLFSCAALLCLALKQASNWLVVGGRFLIILIEVVKFRESS